MAISGDIIGNVFHPQTDARRIEVDNIDTNTTLVGQSLDINPSLSSPVWLINRIITEEISTDVFGLKSVDYVTQKFDQIWDDRLSLFDPPVFVNNTSVLCDGVNDILVIGDVTELSFDRLDPFSIAIWFRQTFTGAGERILFSKQGSSNNTGYRFTSQGGQLRFHLSGGAGGDRIEARTGTVNSNDDQWHLGVVTYDGSSALAGVNIYFDNVDEVLTPTSDNLTLTTVNTIDAQISGRNGTSSEWEGFADEISVYKRQLSGSDQTIIWNSGVPGDLLNTLSQPVIDDNVGWWRFDNDIFPNIVDQGPNTANTAVMTNMGPEDLVGEVPK